MRSSSHGGTYKDCASVNCKVRDDLESCREECRMLRERLISSEENAEWEKKCRFVSVFFFPLALLFLLYIIWSFLYLLCWLYYSFLDWRLEITGLFLRSIVILRKRWQGVAIIEFFPFWLKPAESGPIFHYV